MDNKGDDQNSSFPKDHEEKTRLMSKIMPQSPLISFEYLVQNELQQEFINGVPIMTHPTVNSNVKSTSMKPGYQVFRPQQQQQQSTSKDNIEVWLHGPR